tara:strand:- start:107 stop:295 length:189 start_codon:yes stop_codon:yes gene_type:complete
MKKGDLLIDHVAETTEDKIGIIVDVDTSQDNVYFYVDVAYPHGIYEVEIPKDGSDELEVISV